MIKFGKRDDTGAIGVVLNGVQIGAIVSPTYDRHTRRNGGGGYEIYIRHEGRALCDSDQILADLKRRVVAFLNNA